ncbi:type II secretion system protein GspD [Marinobacterium nitratireducens]|uniref:Type II secretion system protein GspD n=1 Tax=Marinobacterium nitratireducens TaxID=518897 RepID=A0A917ZC51_9GAMM|nr:type II secretion system secretin GspD [Marinobacterium nitratireducens]GGO80131.1 type II secretion system protein GspD [Marinobacterium nitratireducens]
MSKAWKLSMLFVSSVLLSACMSHDMQSRNAMDSPWRQEQPRLEPDEQGVIAAGVASRGLSTDARAAKQMAEEPRFASEAGLAQAPQTPRAEFYGGNGVFFDARREPAKTAAEGDITFNFQGAEISEVVKTILGDILGANYILDDRVRGAVNMQTSRPISREALVPTLEKLLQVNGAALIDHYDFYEVVPLDSVDGGAISVLGNLGADRGYQMLVVPLRYIGAQEMLKILEPLKPRQGMMEADERRNLLMLAGTQAELVNLRETIKTFDVDQLQGMSVGLFRLNSVDPETLVSELETIFGDSAEGPLAGMVRFMPIERLNGILVITPQRKYLTDARAWIMRLDRSEGAQGLGMYVYYVQNGRAENMADMLGQLFEGQRRERQARQSENARRPRSATTEGGDEPVGGEERTLTRAEASVGGTSVEVGEVSIIADEENNALLIMASPSDYDKVYKAIQKLDVLPLQVLVEATIVEVSLEDELQYGLQWFFKNSLDGGSKTGIGTIGNSPIPSASDLFGSSSYEVLSGGETRGLLNLLARDSRLNVVSSPTLMVLDNHTAEIRVGDQVPIQTSTTTNTSSDTGNVTSTIQYRDTGVLLEVTPRVNAGGMVVLDITQEVNDVDQTTSSGIDSPTIIQRRVNTSVAVQSGETLVLGGLIKENNTKDNEGVPYLRHVPVLGWAFGSRGKSVQRTELVVMITPTAVTDTADAREVTREYQNKLRGLDLPSIRRSSAGRSY